MKRNNVHIEIYRECITEKSFRRIIKNELQKSGAIYDEFDYDNTIKNSLHKGIGASWSRFEIEKNYSIYGNFYKIDYIDYIHCYGNKLFSYYFYYYYNPLHKEARFNFEIEYK